MEELRPDTPPDLKAIAKRVAAWHNRHPLARRITPAQVQGVGWVALPFAQRPGVAPLAQVLHASPPDAAPPSLNDGAPALVDPPDRPDQGPQAETTAASPVAAFDIPVLQAQLPLPQRWWLGLKIAWHAAKRRRAQTQVRRKALLAAFSEDFIAPVSPRQAAQWALGHGLLQPGLGDWPLRTVLPDPAWGRQDASLLNLYLATAAIEVGGRRARVLVPVGGRQRPNAVLGPRLMSPQRGLAALALALVAASVLGVLQPQLAEQMPASDWPGLVAATVFNDSPASAAAMARSASSAAAAEEPAVPEALEAVALLTAQAPVADSIEPVASAAPAETVAPVASAPPPKPAGPGVQPPPGPTAAAPLSRPEEAPAVALPVAAPVVVNSSPSVAALPPDDPPPRQSPFGPGQRLVPLLDEATKLQAKETIAALRAARGDVPITALATAPAPAPATAPAKAPATATAGFAPSQIDAIAAFALTSRVLRTRAESEQMQAAVRALLAQHTAEPLLVELWPSGEDWQVVCWPFTRRQDAQLARAVLLTRGLRMETVEF